MKLDSDDFTLFGLPRRFALDAALLGTRWRELQTQVHPDRFASEGAASQRLAMQWAVRVNEGYRRLKDPLSRATYLCELAGQSLGDAQAVGHDVLTRQMQWHEELAEAPSADAVKTLEAEVAARLAQIEEGVRADLDERHEPEAALPKLREWMFLRRLLAEIERRLEVMET
jgi:molecular chaperone HscB